VNIARGVSHLFNKTIFISVDMHFIAIGGFSFTISGYFDIIVSYLLEALLEQINHHLEQNSIIVSLGSINIIDATVIEAKQSRKRKGRDGNNTQGMVWHCFA
jgi:hypothetical protein